MNHSYDGRFNDDDGEEDNGLMSNIPKTRSISKKLQNNCTLPLCAWTSAVTIVVSLMILAIILARSRPLRQTYETGFESDLGPIRPEIQLVQQAFTGGVELDENGTFYQNEDTTQPRYVGTPSRDLDIAWDELLSGLNFNLPSREIHDLRERTYMWQGTDQYLLGLDVFHSLHCLNRIRQALYPEYYHQIFENANDPSRQIHIDHCIDHLRQALQCHSDLTPMEWEIKGETLILKTGTVHTCRDFREIHQWASARQIVDSAKKAFVNGKVHIVD